MARSLTVFAGSEAVASGDEALAIRTVNELFDARDNRIILVFDDLTGEQVDLDLRGVYKVAIAEDEAAHRGPGRPKLGVVGREVTLLPRHWEWLNSQPGGASVALRKLVEHAMKKNRGADLFRSSLENTIRFMSVMAGNEPGFEEACRSLARKDREGFEARIASWPKDVADFSRRLAQGVFES